MGCGGVTGKGNESDAILEQTKGLRLLRVPAPLNQKKGKRCGGTYLPTVKFRRLKEKTQERFISSSLRGRMGRESPSAKIQKCPLAISKDISLVIKTELNRDGHVTPSPFCL
jgi:hypothetical protein